jgi:hypothetical protein
VFSGSHVTGSIFLSRILTKDRAIAASITTGDSNSGETIAQQKVTAKLHWAIQALIRPADQYFPNIVLELNLFLL